MIFEKKLLDADDGDSTLNNLFIKGIIAGSPQAKKLWNEIEHAAHSSQSIEIAKAAGYPDATGWYKGGPLRPGSNPEDTDFIFLVDKLHIHDGYSFDVSTKVASSIKMKLYGR